MILKQVWTYPTLTGEVDLKNVTFISMHGYILLIQIRTLALPEKMSPYNLLKIYFAMVFSNCLDGVN